MFKSYKTKRDTLIEKAKEKLEVNKNYENKKKKEMDFIKGKSIKIEDWNLEDIQKEYELILKKESKLSSNNRRKIIKTNKQ